MGALADALGGRIAGDLIRANDWNALITGIESADTALGTQITDLGTQIDARIDGVEVQITDLGTRIDTRIDGVEARLSDLGTQLDARLDAVELRVTTLEGQATAVDTRVTQAEAALADLKNVVDALRSRFRRVTLQSDRLRHAVGEIAEITARITDLDGTALLFPDAATRPWVDFVAVWGQFKPVPGFESLGGAGDRTISVRVDASGVARVQLRAEHTEGLTDEVEAEVQSSLSTVLPSTSKSIAQTILQAATPQEAVQNGAFKVMSNEYDRTDATSVRKFADAYYLRNPIDISGKFTGTFQHRWQDHRATVLAFAKNDSDPQTPDPSLGVCSIQITFRDWIAPWINIEYFDDTAELADRYRGRLASRIDDDLAGTADRLKREVVDIVRMKGAIAKQRDLLAIRDAMDQVEVTNPPPFLNRLKNSMRDGVAIQQVLEYSQATALGDSGATTAFTVFTDTSTRSDTQSEAIRAELTGLVQSQVANAEQRLESHVGAEKETLRQELLRTDGPILGLQRSLDEVSGRIGGVQTALERKADITMLGRFLPQ